MHRIVAAALSVLLCAACASNLDLQSAVRTYNNQTACCDSLSRIPTEKLEATETRFEISESGPLFVFPDGGPSYFKGFELPPSDTPYRLEVRSYLFSDGYPARRSAILYPLLTLLDEAKEPILTTRPEQVRFLRSTFSDEPRDPPRLAVTIEVNPASRAKYVVIHTAANMIGQARGFLVSTPGVTLPVGGAFINTGVHTENLLLVGSPVTPPKHIQIRILASP